MRRLLTIYNDRPHFWQWDVGQKLIVKDGLACEVHFRDPDGVSALTCETYQLDGKTVVDVPDVLLQQTDRINAWIYVCKEDKCTIHENFFYVWPRQKPADYVYPKEEVVYYKQMLEKVTEQAERAEEAVSEAAEHADRAEQALGDMGDLADLFVVRMTSPTTVDKTYNEVAYAIADQRPVIMLCDSQILHYATSTEDGITFSRYQTNRNYKNTGIWEFHATLSKDNVLDYRVSTPTKTPNPYALKFTGAVEGTYDGSNSLAVNIPEGEKGDPGEKGEKGDPGSPGADGISPTVDVSKTGKVTTLTITDKNGTKTATINDGEDGENGGSGGELYIVRVNFPGTDFFSIGGSGLYRPIDQPEEEIYAAYLANKTIVCDVSCKAKTPMYRMPLAKVSLDSSRKRRYSFFAIEDMSILATLEIKADASGVYGGHFHREYRIQEDDIPKELPNPNPLVYIDKDGQETRYDGSEVVTIRQSTELGWLDVTNKPFTSETVVPATPFNYENVIPGFEAFPGMAFIMQPFELVEGDEYVTDINGIRFASTCIHVDAELGGKRIVGTAIGNAAALVGGEPNLSPFAAIQFMQPLQVAAGVYAYGSYLPLMIGDDYAKYYAGTFSIMRKDRTDCIINPEALPPATPDTLGAVRVGEGLTVDAAGVLGVKKDALILSDTENGKTYKLTVTNGKLTMQEVV